MLTTAEGKHEPRLLLEAVDAVWGHLVTEKQQLPDQQVYRDTHCKPEVTVKSLIGRVSLRREHCSKWPCRTATEGPASLGATANSPGHMGVQDIDSWDLHGPTELEFEPQICILIGLPAGVDEAVLVGNWVWLNFHT